MGINYCAPDGAKLFHYPPMVGLGVDFFLYYLISTDEEYVSANRLLVDDYVVVV